jgi:hypothetical protein
MLETFSTDNARKLKEVIDTCCTWNKENEVVVENPKSQLMHFTTVWKLGTSEDN